MHFLRKLFRHELAGGITVLAVTQFVASIAGLVLKRVLAQTFHDHLGVVDAYIAAFRPSDLLFQACIMSAMGTILVPVLASYRAKGDTVEMSRVLNGTMAVAAGIFGVIALLLAVSLPWLAPYFVQFTGEELQLYIQFGRLALLTNFLFVFGNALGQYLITVQRYWIYGLTPILYTCGTIAGSIFLTPYFGAYGPIIGTVAGAVVYVALRWGAVLYSGGGMHVSFWHPDIKEMGVLMIPRILSLGAFQIQLLFLDRIASGFTEGSVTVNNYAQSFQSVLVGVVGIAIAQSVYSVLSQAAARKDEIQFSTYLRTGMWICIALTIPGAVLLVALAPVAAWLVHMQSTLHVFTVCLVIYAFSIPFESISHLQLRAFYAKKNTVVPAVWGVMGGVGAILAGSFLASRYGIYSVAAGYTLGEIVQTVGLWWELKRKK